MKEIISSLIVGLLFGAGLGVSGMMSPVKVQGFLDLLGRWDPSLALVMGGAVAITFVSFPLILKRKQPIFAQSFGLPSSVKIDKSLLIGALLFGTGWAIGGLCPGPALANLASFNPGVIAFVISMITGFWAYRVSAEYLIHQHSSNVEQEAKELKELNTEQCLVD